MRRVRRVRSFFPCREKPQLFPSQELIQKTPSAQPLGACAWRNLRRTHAPGNEATTFCSGKLMKHEGFYLMKQYEKSTWDFG